MTAFLFMSSCDITRAANYTLLYDRAMIVDSQRIIPTTVQVQWMHDSTGNAKSVNNDFAPLANPYTANRIIA